ncbi:MAG: LPXTG cell wall anchor domain-containing protein [Candidatus Thermoplasmatota archaeon]|nr:LPXTG cell wall anchor domain-containing protein [Candidatus Thermoplasmatota archaeon]
MRLAFLLASMILLSSICLSAQPAMAQGDMPQPPYIILVEVSMSDGSPADGTQVFVNNTRTGETKQTSTSGGRAVFALARYQQGDLVKITAIKDNMHAETTMEVSLADGKQTVVPHLVELKLAEADDTGVYIMAFAGAAAAALAFILLLVFIRRKKDDKEKEAKNSGNMNKRGGRGKK